MDLVFTDKNWKELGVVENFGMDLAYGTDENDFTCEIPYDTGIEQESFVFIDGTSYGGLVRGFQETSDADGLKLECIGQTWHGLMASTVLIPPAGQTHFKVDCDANTAIARVIAHTGLDKIFEVSTLTVKNVAYQFDRFCTVYGGITKMLSKNGLKLTVTKDSQSKPRLAAVPAMDYTSGELALESDYKIKIVRPVNHLVCIGIGEMEERTVVHLYADADGKVSKTQTIFYPQERQELYEYSSLEEAELTEAGTKKLEELQDTDSIEISPPSYMTLDVGDMVGAESEYLKVLVKAEIAKVVVKVGADGQEITYETGDDGASLYSKA